MREIYTGIKNLYHNVNKKAGKLNKQEEKQKEIYEINDFIKYCHLWNIFSGGSGKGVVLLRKIIDSIQNDNYKNPYKKLPSFLIVGEQGTGKKLVARAIANSLICDDVRECPGQYFGDSIPTYQFFLDSFPNTVHIITNIEKLNKAGESAIWKYLKQGICKYYNYAKKNYDIMLKCNGMIILTATSNKNKKAIVDAVDYIIELEPYTSEQLELVVHQILKVLCKIEYDGELVLQEIVEQGGGEISMVLDFLKICLMLLKAELKDCMDMEIVEKAKRISCSPVPPDHVEEDIPF